MAGTQQPERLGRGRPRYRRWRLSAIRVLPTIPGGSEKGASMHPDACRMAPRTPDGGCRGVVTRALLRRPTQARPAGLDGRPTVKPARRVVGTNTRSHVDRDSAPPVAGSRVSTPPFEQDAAATVRPVAGRKPGLFLVVLRDGPIDSGLGWWGRSIAGSVSRSSGSR